ncbi:glycoside hydrolase domain-containing protein [Cytobacillus sp. NCCP-133]|uniref:glycoside hydrolase domain-containing protein n=1 Tax=Cytobacillus sp. NCCP-133 TaxID=766848 RepID=UPI0022302BE6|nr:glycoside hydrolase domain-containing protein [Cytobacillus sp. NCCP-133]
MELLQSNDIKILVIWNQFNDATGLENGQNEANAAIQFAQELGIPKGVAIFADIEPSYPVDSAFIEGWYQAMLESPYRPGIYGIFDPERALARAFEQASNGNSALLESTYVWTAAPSVGITTEERAPEYKPQAPEYALIAGWQYGIDAKSCNIDTNLFNGEIVNVLW